jgi:hypothetical protein
VGGAAASPVEGESISLRPGIALARGEERNAKPPSGPKPPAITTLEPIDPWTGEDISPKLELAAAMHRRLEFDRSDPWDPSKVYPGNSRKEPMLDPEPWARGPSPVASHDERIASARIRPKMDAVDPWN